MPIQVVVGANWGDEGKGRMVDYLAQDADYVVRFQGGNNAGHTVVNRHGEFSLHLLPSGVFNPRTVNVLGPGMVIDLQALHEELQGLESKGIKPVIRISERATICFPFNRMEDIWEEERLASRAFGSTRRGIAPAYGDRTVKKAIQLGELLYPQRFAERLKDLVEWKLLCARGIYGKSDPFDYEEVSAWIRTFSEGLVPMLCDTGELLESALQNDKCLLFEAQLGSLRDKDLGIYPFTTSSSVLAGYATAGGGIPGHRPDRTIAVVKEYATCVGAGPFITRMQPQDADLLRESAGEYGATTGRPREIGHFDGFASRYGVKVQGADQVALTKLDCLSGFKSLKLCTGYRYRGDLLRYFPINAVLEDVTPEYLELPGWQEDIGGVRVFEDLPETAQNYVLAVESMLECPISYISVGKERHAIIANRG